MREDDVALAEANRDIAPVGNMVVEGVTAEAGKTYIIDTCAVVDSGEDAAMSFRQHPSVLRRLGHDLHLSVVTASQAGLSQGKWPPEGTDNALVVPYHGDNLSGIHSNDA